jgi:hypothetical protein
MVCTPIIPAEEDHELEASLGNIKRPCLKNKLRVIIFAIVLIELKNRLFGEMTWFLAEPFFPLKAFQSNVKGEC